jgi:hypothetical protein
MIWPENFFTPFSGRPLDGLGSFTVQTSIRFGFEKIKAARKMRRSAVTGSGRITIRPAGCKMEMTQKSRKLA